MGTNKMVFSNQFIRLGADSKKFSQFIISWSLVSCGLLSLGIFFGPWLVVDKKDSSHRLYEFMLLVATVCDPKDRYRCEDTYRPTESHLIPVRDAGYSTFAFALIAILLLLVLTYGGIRSHFLPTRPVPSRSLVLCVLLPSIAATLVVLGLVVYTAVSLSDDMCASNDCEFEGGLIFTVIALIPMFIIILFVSTIIYRRGDSRLLGSMLASDAARQLSMAASMGNPQVEYSDDGEICPACGKPADPTQDQFCSQCGAQLASAAAHI
eukprot:TRINITY_DN7697_c0_g1::TRINITY_DN7697_c0_g1_i1::g.18517::m.18517 TRINITY_DN7697_c0_g1::TRINITY_DN7697_c0_g1_i1::g.18517  ORF type:complete len:266 (+),score=32.84,zf-ribbon_3/PF13248.1/4.1e-06,DZR/PF12773.2/9.7e-05,zinc_ribbon_2/PF13240.1/0.3,zinc_ribbon_2/PF13240.1/0.00036,NOB1_Zn_bind/PF08772.6/0.019,zf-NADH-PPase/PF09297.6/11,zf-NADH-PPase/PF09297.6/0.38,UPF0547/PF10571.4/0.24,DUF898/PF05987.8/0.23,NMD3/PF04981.8/0.21,Prok-RING_1/PF14446.1/0.33,Yip1/PF04893.12/2.1e+03,Yip1/PF04893.12/0.21,zf-C